MKFVKTRLALDKLIISGLIGNRNETLDQLLSEAGIGETFNADMMREYLAQNPEGEINIELNTIGGDVLQGFEIYDLLQAEKRKGRTVNTYGRRFDSIGSIIFLAGDNRFAYSNSKPLIHNAWYPAEALDELELNSYTLREVADIADEMDAQMLHEYMKFAGRDQMRVLQDIMRNSTELSDKQLLELNFATEIIKKEPKAASAALRAVAFAFHAERRKQYADTIVLNGDRVLLIQRSLDDDFEPGRWAFPGGKIEDGELPEAAAVRELNEETGIQAIEIEPLEVMKNEDGSLTHYFLAFADVNEFKPDEDEINAVKLVALDELNPEEIILGQSEKYKSLIQKSVKMSDKLAALEGRFKSLAAKFGLIAPAAMTLPLKDGETTLFVYSEDGEIEGKKAVIAENGEPTETPAPAGKHELNDGREITVGPEGLIESVSVQGAEGMKEEEEMAAMKEEMTQAMNELEEVKAQAAKRNEELEAVKAEKAKVEETLKNELSALKTEIEELKEVVPGQSKSENPDASLLAAVKNRREQMEKLKPSERRLQAAIAAAKKS